MNGTRRRGNPRKRRRGFTLVELLVVITILGMLMAMMFPALSAVLDTVRLATCKTKMRSVGQALATYKTQRGHWPSVSTQPVNGPPANTKVAATTRRGPTTRNPARDRNQRQAMAQTAGFSWIFHLLPMLGEEILHRKMVIKSTNGSPFDPALLDDDNTHLATKQFAPLSCPVFSSNAEVENTSTAPEYKQWLGSLSDGGKGGVAVTNYVAMSATHIGLVVPLSGRPAPNGVIYYSEDGKGPSRIQDGDERTIVLVETREPGYSAWIDGVTSWVVAANPNTLAPQQKPGSQAWQCNDNSGCKTALNVGPDLRTSEAEAEINYRVAGWGGQAPWQYGPSSQHGSFFVNHLTASGNPVHFISHGTGAIEAQVYMDIVSRGGGESTPVPVE